MSVHSGVFNFQVCFRGWGNTPELREGGSVRMKVVYPPPLLNTIFRSIHGSYHPIFMRILLSLIHPPRSSIPASSRTERCMLNSPTCLVQSSYMARRAAFDATALSDEPARKFPSEPTRRRVRKSQRGGDIGNENSEETSVRFR